MKKNLYILMLDIALFFLSVSLFAQGNPDISNEQAVIQDSMLYTKYLQNLVDSLQNELRQVKDLYVSQQLELQNLRSEIDSFKQVGTCDMTYLLNYGNALLYRKYSARTEDIALLLSNAPDSLKRKDYEQTMECAKRMIQSSNVTQDMRNRVFHMLEKVPYDEQFASDIREVLQNVPSSMQTQYSLTNQAIELINAMPKNVTENENRYAIVRELLEAYGLSNEEIKETLTTIQNHPNNSINISDNWSEFIKQIKSTKYYERYYKKSWTIPYLNSIIDQAILRLQNASKRVNLDDLIKKL